MLTETADKIPEFRIGVHFKKLTVRYKNFLRPTVKITRFYLITTTVIVYQYLPHTWALGRVIIISFNCFCEDYLHASLIFSPRNQLN